METYIYYLNEKAEAVEITESKLNCYGYFLSGYNELRKGELVIMYTTEKFDFRLTPVYNLQGYKIIKKEFAGKLVSDIGIDKLFK